ncbi:MAG TPA: carboxysome shell protein, partial [Prochlorococcaceae cyanobacterium Gl_MAG_24]|nr:carboxysome shell protein [Prochlorococcaceae cyanobacterium Gl_MAG_24]
MAKQSSRELVLERRKALSQGGKKSVAASGSTSNRVRTASDARSTRTNTEVGDIENSRSKSHQARPSNRAAASLSKSSSTNLVVDHSPKSRHVKKVSQPGRDLVLARRDALSKRGKIANTSKDRTRVDVHKSSAAQSKVAAVEVKYCCDECETKDRNSSSSVQPVNASELSLPTNSGSKKSTRRPTTKRRAIQNPSRALVLARREAQSK